MNYSEDEQNLIALAAMDGMTYNERYSALSALMSFTPDFSSCKNSLIKRRDIGVYNKIRESFYDDSFREKVFTELEKRGVECVTYASEDYPELLKHIPEPPIVLFCRGRRQLLKTRCFSVVGSRRTATNILAVCKRFATELSEHFTIVSGSAQGADSAALEGAAGRAISVIAHGFDYIPGSSAIIKKVESGGLLISEYYPTVAPQNFLYHERNRVIAGLSEGTLIVSAGQKSGALITASHAANYGREVFAFPYNIGVSSGEGCNNLIKEGATLCRDTLDILTCFGLDFNPLPSSALSDDEQAVLGHIKENGDCFLPEMSRVLGIPPYKLLPLLSALEIKGLVCRLGGNRYGII